MQAVLKHSEKTLRKLSNNDNTAPQKIGLRGKTSRFCEEREHTTFSFLTPINLGPG